MTDTIPSDLIERMAKELDRYRQFLRDDRRQTHPLAIEARTYLAQPEPEGPTDDELDYLWAEIDGGPDCCAWRPYARAVIAADRVRAARRPKPPSLKLSNHYHFYVSTFAPNSSDS